MAAVLLMMPALTVKAQKYESEVYVMVGAASTNMNANEGGEAKYGLVMAIENNWRLTKLLGVTAGIGYMNMGAQEKASDSRISLHYVNVPVMANFRIAGWLSANIGVQGAYLVANDLTSHGEKLMVSGMMKSVFNKFDFGVPLGLSFHAKKTILQLRYYYGLRSPFKSEFRNSAYLDEHDGDNRAFYIMLGYRL